MADEGDGNFGVAKDLFFKGEDDQGAVENAAHDADAPGAPGPNLRSDEISEFEALAAEFFAQWEVGAGRIDEHAEGGFSYFGFFGELAEDFQHGGNFVNHFGDAEDGDLFGVDDDFDAGGAHAFATHAEDVRASFGAEGGGEAGAVHVTGGFAGGDENLEGSPRLSGG